MGKFAAGFLLGASLLPAIVLLVLFAGWVRVEATADPSRWETVFARASLAASLARHAPRAQNQLPVTSENLRAGLKMYRDNCSGCHGDSGKPSHWGSTAFYPRAPQFDLQTPSKPE